MLMCQTVLREGTLVRDFRLSGNPIRQDFDLIHNHVCLLLLSADVHHNTRACLYVAQSIATTMQDPE